MKIKEIYRNVISKIKNYFNFRNESSSDLQNYFVSGVSPNVLNSYRILYSPDRTKFIRDSSGTKFSKTLETKLENVELDFKLLDSFKREEKIEYLKRLEESIKGAHIRNMQRIKMNHLKSLGNIYSSVVEKMNKTVENVKGYIFESLPFGGVRLSFVF